jgi:hypothetical protein
MAGAAGRSAGGLAGGGDRGFAAGRYPYPKCLHSELLVFVAESRASLLSLRRQLICSEKDISNVWKEGIFFLILLLFFLYGLCKKRKGFNVKLGILCTSIPISLIQHIF